MELVGRSSELAVLAQACADVRAGGRRTIGVVGAAASARARCSSRSPPARGRAGLLELDGRAAEHERDVPLALVIDALDDHVASLPPARLAAAGPELRELLPAAAAGEAVPGPVATSPAERFRHHRALRALLELMGRDRPLALVLDDLHWADEASTAFVLHLLHRPARVPHLLASALRPVAPAAALLDAARAAPG